MKTCSLLPVLGFFALFTSFTLNATSPKCPQQRCVGIVDAGSTGSRIYLFAYDLDQTQTPINIKELGSKKVKPGLSSIDGDKTAIENYLKSLFAEVPKENFPVYFFATAGMRLLPEPKQQRYYQYIKNWFKQQSYWQLQAAKTISGSEEGLYGWLSINYKIGAFNPRGSAMVGVMDMGGASVQISFPIDKNENLSPFDVQSLDIYGQHLELFSHSFLGLGQTEVTRKYLEASSCFAKGYELLNGQYGDGDASLCEQEISKLVNGEFGVNRIVQSAKQYTLTNQWFVMGSTAQLVQSKPFKFKDKQFTNQLLLDQANEEICQQSWSYLKEKYDNNDYLYGYCLFPSYYYALMVKGYGIEPQQTVSFIGSDEDEINWTLGAVIAQKSEASN